MCSCQRGAGPIVGRCVFFCRRPGLRVITHRDRRRFPTRGRTWPTGASHHPEAAGASPAPIPTGRGERLRLRGFPGSRARSGVCGTAPAEPRSGQLRKGDLSHAVPWAVSLLDPGISRSTFAVSLHAARQSSPTCMGPCSGRSPRGTNFDSVRTYAHSRIPGFAADGIAYGSLCGCG